ncbi:sigma 54-interacting transcriptional regulator [Leptospira kanakyensis]|uniref:sigma 54-interacting transcriptional regulator n=1 Tax=Leptospira kanakyensis TaxID=2484968 RepID=UPI00223C8C80|nr:sigma-54 dependent transcriptional regulator [Leptospira kanakyensis]MCW7468790.1 sigma-54 dependent transcriptional regulator [Leptospira kanakyensis]
MTILFFFFFIKKIKKSDLGTIWFSLYFLFLTLFNLGYIIGYSIFSEWGSVGWTIACSFAFAAVVRLQISYTFPSNIFGRERKWSLWIGILFSFFATIDYLIQSGNRIQYSFSVHSFGSDYSSPYIPAVGFLAYLFSIIVSIRRIFSKFKILKKEKKLNPLSVLWKDKEIRISINLIIITIFEFTLTSFYFLGYVRFISVSFLADLMNLGTLIIFSGYALVYTSSSVGRTGFIPRLLGLSLVFVLFFSTLTSRYYESKIVSQYKNELENGSHSLVYERIKENDFNTEIKSAKTNHHYDGMFHYAKIKSNFVVGVFNHESGNFFLYDYLQFRKYLHELLIPSFYIQIFSVVLVLIVFPLFFKISFVLPLNQLIQEIESEFLDEKNKPNSSHHPDSFEFNAIKNAFVKIGSMIRHAKKELPEVSKPLDVIESFLNSPPKEIRIGNQSLIYKSSAFERTIQDVYQASRYPHPVTITGETGSGKELAARLIHLTSEKKSGPFLAVNCATLPETLWEAEIFGAKKGSYTDAKIERKGRIQEADGGSLFFDEIGEVPIFIQAKMLRLLQENSFVPLGSNLEQNANCRFIFATNQNLEDLVRKKLFREDLLYRIKVFHIHLIPLRERMEDIPFLLKFFIQKFKEEFGSSEPTISTEAMQKIITYPWPGNIRELENFVTRFMSHVAKEKLELEDILPFFSKQSVDIVDPLAEYAHPKGAIGLEEEINILSRLRILQALEAENGNVTRAAERLDLKRTTLRYKMIELGILQK